MRIEVDQELDERNEPVEFTFDLFPLVDAAETAHLDENGLAKPGTIIKPGMVLVGRIGKTTRYDQKQLPTAMEIHGLSQRELQERYGAMWKDYSFYATESMGGTVRRAFLETAGGRLRAVVELDEPSGSETTSSHSCGRSGTKSMGGIDDGCGVGAKHGLKDRVGEQE